MVLICTTVSKIHFPSYFTAHLTVTYNRKLKTLVLGSFYFKLLPTSIQRANVNDLEDTGDPHRTYHTAHTPGHYVNMQNKYPPKTTGEIISPKSCHRWWEFTLESMTNELYILTCLAIKSVEFNHPLN